MAQAVLHDLFSSIMALADELTAESSAHAQSAGSDLYVLLFQATDAASQKVQHISVRSKLAYLCGCRDFSCKTRAQSNVCQSLVMRSTLPCMNTACSDYKSDVGSCECMQEVLRALHAHLGSSAAPQVSTALAALHSLSIRHASALLGHTSVLMAILDHMDAFAPDQLHTVRHLKQTPDARKGHMTRVQKYVPHDICKSEKTFASMLHARWTGA